MVVTEELQENFVIEGVAPVSLRSINQSIDQRLCVLEERLVNKIGQNNHDRTPQENINQSRWRTWYWNDGLLCHFVPENWEFPSRLSVKTLWDLWWFGDQNTGIRPFKDIDFSIELQVMHAMRHSRAKAVIEYYFKVEPSSTRGVNHIKIANRAK
jgi:hypothetical protein